MGEARRRAAARIQRTSLVDGNREKFIAVASAMRRMARAASAAFGRDCHIHASLTLALLDLPEAELAVGYAAWRVGEGDGDVIVHAPVPGQIAQPGGLAYHAWIELGDYLFDPTLYQLRTKAAQLDALDGGRTSVEWAPDYLLVRRQESSPLGVVTRGHAGLFHYARIPDLERRMAALSHPVDPEDLAAARLLLANPDMQALGPNDWG